MQDGYLLGIQVTIKLMQKQKIKVKPGIIGYSQVYMKRQHDVMPKAWFDSEYLKIMNPWVDFKIIIHTYLFIFKGK